MRIWINIPIETVEDKVIKKELMHFGRYLGASFYAPLPGGINYLELLCDGSACRLPHRLDFIPLDISAKHLKDFAVYVSASFSMDCNLYLYVEYKNTWENSP